MPIAPPALPHLTPRLKQAAVWVRLGVHIADVGTDHAYLCAYLALHDAKASLLACDIAENPLQNAAQTLEAYGLTDRVELRLSDGLDNVKSSEADDILMLGMGGTLISRLLDRCAWLRNERKQLILQPMSRAEEVRAWLCNHGFCILEEAVVREGRRLYIVMRARFNASNADDFPFGYAYFGELPKLDATEAKIVLERTAARLEKKARALGEAGQDDAAQESYAFAAAVRNAAH
ncbi:MAG: class I SAM-dependent methyltransferase [Oscillospiraceae bacterium]|nr:class I SAM-dependent methyltransferase [Oscillospiraceae bacterium]